MVNHNRQFVDITGQRFYRWSVIGIASKTSDNHQKWHCICDCGAERDVLGKDLRNGKSKSCGCLSRELSAKRAEKHGLHKHPLYTIWCNMHSRCENPNNPSFYNYGGRGIKICEEWNNPESFILWGISHGYSEGLQLDRINNDGDYSPENCRFVPLYVNQNNKRTNWNICFCGIVLTISQWSTFLGVPEARIRHRLYSGWSVEDALFKPKSK